MKKSAYKIIFSGLKNGVHYFDYKLDEAFFSRANIEYIKGGTVDVHLTFEKQERMIIIVFDIQGALIVPCDRCLDDLNFPIASSQTLIIKFGKTFEELDDDVIVIPETEIEFEVFPYLCEFVQISLPMQRMHGEDENGNLLCNPEIVKKLNGTPSDEFAIDARWEALKKLKVDTDK